MFALRGTPVGRRGTMQPPSSGDKHIRYRYLGADQVSRSLEITFSWGAIVAPRTVAHTVAHWDLVLAAQESKSLIISLRVIQHSPEQVEPHSAPSVEEVRRYRDHTSRDWLSGLAQVRSSDGVLNDTVQRSFGDIRMLRIEREGHSCIAAGIPWFVGLFGRDSVIPSLQCLAFDQEVAAHTARILARYQGRMTDLKRHEEPKQDSARNASRRNGSFARSPRHQLCVD